MAKPSYVLGLNVYDHDVSACLLRDGAIAYAVSKERVTREKHASGFFQEVIDYCLRAEGITLDDVGMIVRNSYILPVEEMERRLLHQEMPYYLNGEDRKRALNHPLFLSQSEKLVTVSHHLAHAYSAFAACPFTDGVIMVVDGVGSYRSDVTEAIPPADTASALARESESYYRFDGSQIQTLKKIWMEPSRGFLNQEFFTMPGLGALYSRVSIYIFADWNKCGEVMGLAPYGRPERVKPLLNLENDRLAVPEWSQEFSSPWLSLAGQDWEKNAAMEHWQDLARRTQDDTETVLLARAKWLRETTGAKNLCMAGGVALNCVANGRIAREAGFENVWIQPAAGDDGIAIGCAYYGHLALQGKPRSFVMKNAFLGVDYSAADVRRPLANPLVRLAVKAESSADICADTARVLAEGQIVGWFQGRSEFGPRALGNRSILADPRDPTMKDRLNKRVKHRQSFRPFAPIVLAERANEVFACDGRQSPFMLLAEAVRPDWREKIPAIVHVDGTARLQTVSQEDNPVLYALLKAFEARTGVPVLLNTSFNVKGEPIVETPADALACFLGTGIDCLVLHDMMISKRALHRFLSPLVQIYSDVAAIVRTGLGQT